ncbi:dihydrodipicolinate synthase family protein [Rhodopirellula bahusiensis]|uniref:Dihydrodipicolinate synthase family protein n=1 Tax=Rhodopirellula bahusiensis TaxID=2014065 RepID=A0A2G1WDB6_9BACT|nr:dihydrodipicolinate synthase family protein [Rhodopirellula bahusiensis]PHQ36996.1 dihydrodipicolinate synthase family protein [Rhodopirellula bahusiensis]
MIHGIIPPLVTPLADRDRLDVSGVERLLGQQLSAGVDGVFILGTTGEGPSLSDDVQHAMIDETSTVVDQQVPIYVGITDTSLVRAIKLAEFAADQGAEAVVAAPPFYFPAGQTELQNWFRELADSLPLPLLLYNMPSCVKISIEVDTLRALIEHENIVGLKDSSGDLKYFAQAVEVAATRESWPVLMGPEAKLVEAMRLGAAGGVTGGANLFPKLFTDLFAAITNGEQAEVDRLQQIVVELQDLYMFGKYGSSYLKGLKCAMELSGICSGQLAAPFDAFKEPQREQVHQWLTEFSKRTLLDETMTQG